MAEQAVVIPPLAPPPRAVADSAGSPRASVAAGSGNDSDGGSGSVAGSSVSTTSARSTLRVRPADDDGSEPPCCWAWHPRTSWRALSRRPHARFAVLDVARTLAMLWVHVLHTNSYVVYYADASGAAADDVPALQRQWYADGSSVASLPWTSGGAGVDVFFVLSGFLCFHLLWDRYLARQPPQVPRFYFSRAVRLVPPVAVAVAASGFVYGAASDCVDDWWQYVGMVNNWVTDEPESKCLSHAWSVSVEAQLYLVTPLLVVCAWWVYRPRPPGTTARLVVPLAVLASAVVVCLVARAVYVVSYAMYEPAFFAKPGAATVTAIHAVYTLPFTRMGPFVMGMMLSHWYHETLISQARARKLSVGSDSDADSLEAGGSDHEQVGHHHRRKAAATAPQWPLWVKAAAYVAAVACLVVGAVNDQRLSTMAFGKGDIPSWAVALVLVFARHLTAAGACLLIYMELSGQAAWLTTTSSWRVWFMGAQLSYAAYLLQFVPLRLVYEVLPVTSAATLGKSYMLLRVAMSLPLTLLLAAVSFFVVESPLLRLRGVVWPVVMEQPHTR